MKLNHTETQIIEAIKHDGEYQARVFKGYRNMKPTGKRVQNALKSLQGKGLVKLEVTFKDTFCVHYKATMSEVAPC